MEKRAISDRLRGATDEIEQLMLKINQYKLKLQSKETKLRDALIELEEKSRHINSLEENQEKLLNTFRKPTDQIGSL